MLNRIRKAVEPAINLIGMHAARTGLPPSFWTVFGLPLSMLSAFAYGNVIIGGERMGGLLLLLSGVMDITDGSVARVTGTVSKRGAFLDSSLDRLAEVVVFAGILYGNLVDHLLALLALSFSLLVSYVRARAEALGASVSGVGLGERAERLMVLSVSSIVGYTTYGVMIVLFLAALTFLQRIKHIMAKLKG